MKQITLLLLLFTFVVSAAPQNAPPGRQQFDVEDFNKKLEVVEWLVEYDNVAWKTTDVLLKQEKKELERLGPEWFCFQDKNKVWHAVYGKLNEAGYDVVFHFVIDSAGNISRSDVKLGADFVTDHARALATARNKLSASIPEGSPRFNQYIRQNSDNTFSVWLLPAFQTNRLAVYGGEAIYTIDRTGRKLIKDESYFQPAFRGFKSEPPREIWLNYREMKKPSLGAIFFVWYYKPYFTQIFIDNETSVSTLIKTDKGYMWTHVEKEVESKPRSN